MKTQGSPSDSGVLAPPPPTTQNASATKPTQECPLHAKHPCAVNKLMLKVTGWELKEDEEKKLKLETTKVRTREPVTDVKDKQAIALLRTYDLMIDCLAEPNGPSNNYPRAAEIEGRSYYTAPECEVQSHALLELLHLGASEDAVIKKELGASEIELEAHKLYAMTSYLDRVDDRKGIFDEAATVFGIVKSFIESITGHVTEADLRAFACGTRARGDGAQPNRMLLARVRVFRRSRWSIGLKIPPLGSFKAEKERSVDVRGLETTTTSSKTTAGAGYYQNTTTGKVTKGDAGSEFDFGQHKQVGEEVKEYQATGSADAKGNTTERTFREQSSSADGRKMAVNEDGEMTVDEIKKRLERESGFDLVITIDNKEIETGEGIKKIKEQIHKISEVIKDVRKLFEKAPQVGWKFTFDVSVLAGTIGVECFPEYVPGPRANGRYYPVQHKFTGSIELTVFAISIEVSFGVEAQALDSGLVLKIQGTLTLKCKLEKELSLDFFTPRQEFEVNAEAMAELAVVGYVSVLGKTFADGKLSVSSGLQFQGTFEVEVSARPAFDLKGKLKTKPILLSGYIRGPMGWQKKIDPSKELLPERELCALE
jgi:hypothetical protein